MTKAAGMLPIRASVSGRWQVPVLSVGLVLFGGGLVRLAANYRSRSFTDDVALTRRLRDAKQLPRASAFLVERLKDQDQPISQRAELHRLLAATIHEAEAPLTVHSPRNVAAIIRNFRAAARLEREPSSDDWNRVADAYRWAGNESEAVDAYRQALRLGTAGPDTVRRRIVELRSGFAGKISDDAESELDAILSDENASPGNYLWAVERKTLRLLDHGDAATARGLVAKAGERLSGSAARVALPYLGALTLWRLGLSDEAEARLRALRNEWAVRDELWGKSGWLLGRIQQEDDRPQAALSFYEEVLRSFETGELHDACLFGGAECLASLGRHSRALETFSELQDRLLAVRRHRYLDRDTVRASVTSIGLSMLSEPAVTDGDPSEGDAELGIRYLRLGLELVEPADEGAQVPYLSRIASGLSAMADAAVDASRGKRLHREAGEAHLRLSRVQRDDGAASARSNWEAIEHFAKADRRHRVIELLERFVAGRPSSLLRPMALHRLGQAYQAEHRYPEAVHAYDTVIHEFEGLPDALASMVPMAQCLLRQGGSETARGVTLLLDIVDDRSPKQWLTPRAREYREALVQLATYYVGASDREVPNHVERAIERLQDTLALYPEDRRAPELTFLLADAYRQSAAGLRRELKKTGRPSADDVQTSAWADRLQAAYRYFNQVVATLAPHDNGTTHAPAPDKGSPAMPSGLSELESTYLRMSYLYRGDCLFDLRRYDEAIAAYEEAAWRYDHMPAAVSASMQIYHCYQRVGRTEEARAVLGRLHWLIRAIPESVFENERGMPSKRYWEALVNRLDRLAADAVSG
ncbi:MAG: tol-pal system YbgF family protein [Phycisphaerae bacterium]